MPIYFDNAATTPVASEVIVAMQDVLENIYGNPSSVHSEGRKARAAIERARRTVAGHLNASIGEVFFTSGGTESNNTALKCAVRDLGIRRIISSPAEHPCVLLTLQEITQHSAVELSLLKVDSFGFPDMNQLEQLLALDPELPTLVSLMHANNETGSMIDLQFVADLCQKKGALFHSDTVQTIGYYPIDVSSTPVAFLSGSAHKFHGPKGVGFLYINNDHLIRPYLHGGSQERNMRAGTENIHSIVGMAKAMDLAYAQIVDYKQQILRCREHLLSRIANELPEVQVHNSPTNCHYKIISLSIPYSSKSDLIIMQLDIAGICVSGGSACSSGAEHPSHVLEAIGADPHRKSIRVSFSHFNNTQEVDFFVDSLRAAL